MFESYNDQVGIVKVHFPLVKNDKDFQLSFKIDCEHPDKIQSKKSFASVKSQTIRVKNQALAENHFNRTSIIAFTVASSFYRNCFQGNLFEALHVIKFDLTASYSLGENLALKKLPSIIPFV